MQIRLLTVYSAYTGSAEIPQIRIQGKWLEKLGFNDGKKFIVEEKYGQLVIRLVHFEEAPEGQNTNSTSAPTSKYLFELVITNIVKM